MLFFLVRNNFFFQSLIDLYLVGVSLLEESVRDIDGQFPMMAQGTWAPHLIGPQTLPRLLRILRAAVVILLQLRLLLVLLQVNLCHATASTTPSGPGNWKYSLSLLKKKNCENLYGVQKLKFVKPKANYFVERSFPTALQSFFLAFFNGRIKVFFVRKVHYMIQLFTSMCDPFWRKKKAAKRLQSLPNFFLVCLFVLSFHPKSSVKDCNFLLRTHQNYSTIISSSESLTWKENLLQQNEILLNNFGKNFQITKTLIDLETIKNPNNDLYKKNCLK